MVSDEKPICYDLFCGLGGWAQGFLAEGYRVIGYDIEAHDYGDGGYPGELRLMDVRQINGADLRDATCIVASPPCQEFSYMAMPWSRAKQIKAALLGKGEFPEGYKGSRTIAELTDLFNQCLRIQREAGRHIPLVIENVRGACPWVGQSGWHYGSYHLWGDLPALMPITLSRKTPVGSWDTTRKNYNGDHSWQAEEGTKWGGCNGKYFDARPKGNVAMHREGTTKNDGGLWFNIAHNTTSGCGNNPDGRKLASENGRRTDVGKGARFTSRDCGLEAAGTKQNGSGREWFAGEGKISREPSSHSPARKRASAEIAKIPFPLAQHIARCFKPLPQAMVMEGRDPRSVATKDAAE